VLLGEGELERLVLAGERVVPAERVAEREPLAPQLATGLGQVQAVGRRLAVPPFEVVGDLARCGACT